MLISVIIPAYNAERYIVRCLDSIYAQSHKEIEVIVVNDGSTDNTGIVLGEYKVRHKDLVVVEQENGGVSRARNAGIDVSSGEYIAFIDADDTIDNDYFSKLLENIQEHDADIVICGCRNIDSDSNNTLFIDSPLNHQIKLGNGDNIVFWGVPWGKLYKSSMIKGKCYFEEGVLFEDDPYSIMVHSLAHKIVSIDYIGYNYYVNNPASYTGIEAREHKFAEVFPFSAYENAIKKVIELGNEKSFFHLQIYYYLNMLNILYRRINKKKRRRVASFHYEMCQKYCLSRRMKLFKVPWMVKIKLRFIRFVSRLYII